MKHSVTHSLAQSKAKDVLGRALDTYREHYAEHSVETAWLDEETAEIGFQFTGKRIDGRIQVREETYDIDLKLPWILRPFKKRIAQSVDQELQRWIARA